MNRELYFQRWLMKIGMEMNLASGSAWLDDKNVDHPFLP